VLSLASSQWAFRLLIAALNVVYFIWSVAVH
jgi:hypothetical protein